MNTVVYISRHSQPFRDLLGEYNTNEDEQVRNEKNPLSVVGEEKAKLLSEYDELKEINILYSSNYVRAMSTAKYIAVSNNIKLNVDERFGERKFGVSHMSELPKDYFEHQFTDWNYKIGNGECLNDVSKRMKQGLLDLLENYKSKKIMIVAHGTSLTTMLKEWCDIKLNCNTKLVEIYFDNNLIFNGDWKTPELFRLVFNENNELINITNIKGKWNN